MLRLKLLPYTKVISARFSRQYTIQNSKTNKNPHRHTRYEMPKPRIETLKTTLITSNEQIQLPWDTIEQIPKPTQETRRLGVLGTKVGMTQLFNDYGQIVPITIVHIDSCQVLSYREIHPSSKPNNNPNVYSVELCCTTISGKQQTKPKLGQFFSKNILPKRHIQSMIITKDSILPIGWTLNAQHFLPGQYIDVRGLSTGKGFAGGMKRHNFHGQDASHGVSLAHRSIGSTGQNSKPGRVFKNKKMPGHLGNTTTYVRNLRIYRIDPIKNLLYIIGPIPGKPGNILQIRDSYYHPLYIPTNDGVHPIETDPKSTITVVPPHKKQQLYPFNPPFPTFIDSLMQYDNFTIPTEPFYTIPKIYLGPDPFVGGNI